MSKIPGDLRYSDSHEWARMEDDGSVTIGISDHAQAALGDLVYVELPETGKGVTAGDACAVVESVKAASDVYAPISGEIVAVNEALDGAPQTINEDPYGDGWLMRIMPSDPGEYESLMDAEAYEAQAAEDEH